MCRYITSNDVYTDCLLWEKASEEALVSKPDEDATKSFNLSSLLQVLQKKFHSENSNSNAPVGGVSGTISPAIPVDDPLAVHVIKQKTIFQCARARDNPDLHADEDKRHCPNPTGTEMGGGAQTTEERTSHVRGRRCPVCKAAEEAVERELDRTDVVSKSLILLGEVNTIQRYPTR